MRQGVPTRPEAKVPQNDENRPLGPVLVERMTGIEPATSTLARWRSSQLSYIRVVPTGP